MNFRDHGHGGHHHGGRHGHHRRPIIVGYPYYYGDYYYDNDYGYSDCGWLYSRAVRTGSPYWWRRYRDCAD
jgi:hypothetical protein